jgi:hypothetical protein
MIRGLVSMAVVATCMASGAAQAGDAPERVSLRWNAPDACPDDSELVHAVEEFLGQPLAASREQRLSVSINVLGSPGSFSAKLSFDSPQGAQERFLEHPECSKLLEGVALLAALAIDPERVKARRAEAEADAAAASHPESEPTPAPEPPPPPPSVPSALSTPTPLRDRVAPPASRAIYEGTLGVAGFVGFGTLPSATPGVATELGLRLQQFRAGLVGRYWLTSSADVPGIAASSIELSLVTVGLRACVLPATDDWSWLACAGADVGDMSGSGQGVDDARTQHDLFAAAEASLSLAYTRSRLAPFAGVAASVALARPRFGVVRDGAAGETFQPGQLGLLAQVGLSYGL